MPRKDKVGAWRILRNEMRAMTMAWELRREKEGVARRHEIERQLRKLESLPTEPSRARQIKRLREGLAGG